MKQAIGLDLIFSGITLPAVDCEDGFRRVPLKPICNAIGVDWVTQRKRVLVDAVRIQLGVCIYSIHFAGQMRSMTMIRIDRVAGFLNRINPNSVRGAGNVSSADLLEGKRNEWDIALHLFEQNRANF